MKRVLATIAFAALFATGASVGSLDGTSMFESSPFQPAVPVSAFARAASWFDPSRLQLSTAVAFGSSFGGASEGLQTTSLSYRFAAPLAMSVSVGRTFGAAAAERGDGFFLQGFDVAYRPHPSLQFQVHFQDVRSPLQYSPYSPYGYYRR